MLRQGLFEKLADLTAALADQCGDDRVEARPARQHGEQRGLADAGSREDADALADAQRREQIDHADAGTNSAGAETT